MSPKEPSPAPNWLVELLRAEGGSVPFRTYMEWALHHPQHGAYGSGRLRIGPSGDFATSPSLGPDFAALLAPQVAQWLSSLPQTLSEKTEGDTDRRPLALVETGPGEGTLALQMAEALAAGWPALAERLELVLVEPNPGMAERQRLCLARSPLPVRWTDFAGLARRPLRGVVLAHEVLDALSVERILWHGGRWCRQRVALRGEDLVLEPGEAPDPEALERLESLGLTTGPDHHPTHGLEDGWCTELHPGLEPWLAACGKGLGEGWLLVIDYGLEARRYYAPQRANGTLMAYRQQRASDDPLRAPGQWDLTAHLCLESLEQAATRSGWHPLGHRRQGEALLALGLAQRLHGLQGGSPAALAELLQRRESLLGLVDPAGLGDFRWIAYRRGGGGPLCDEPPLFLRDPPG